MTATTRPVNIDQVKRKALELLTDLYRTERGDTKRTAMSLLTTLYKVETEEEITAMNEKIQKLYDMIKEDKQIVEELSADSYDYDDEWSSSVEDLSDAQSDEYGEETEANSLKEFSEHPNLNVSDPDQQHQSELLRQAMEQRQENRQWKWQSTKERFVQGWRESTSNLGDKLMELDQIALEKTIEKKENIFNGWRASASKINMALRKNAAPKDDELKTSLSMQTSTSDRSESSLESEAEDSNKQEPSPRGSGNKEEDDLLKVVKNFTKDGSGDSNSRAALEGALETRKPRWSRWLRSQ